MSADIWFFKVKLKIDFSENLVLFLVYKWFLCFETLISLTV